MKKPGRLRSHGLASVLAMLSAGDKAPNFDLLDQDENHVKLADLKGRKAVVYLYPESSR